MLIIIQKGKNSKRECGKHIRLIMQKGGQIIQRLYREKLIIIKEVNNIYGEIWEVLHEQRRVRITAYFGGI